MTLLWSPIGGHSMENTLWCLFGNQDRGTDLGAPLGQALGSPPLVAPLEAPSWCSPLVGPSWGTYLGVTGWTDMGDPYVRHIRGIPLGDET
jgi:hypothetical protein